MNPSASPIELVRLATVLLSFLIAMFNYFDACADERKLPSTGRSILDGMSAQDERQAEMFRCVISGMFLAGYLIYASQPSASIAPPNLPMAWGMFFLEVGLIGAGASSMRARINRKRAIKQAESDLAAEHRSASE